MESLFDAVSAVYDITIEEVTEGTVDEVGMRLDALMRLQGHTATLIEALKQQLLESMTENSVTIVGVGIITKVRKQGSKRLKTKESSRHMREDIAVKSARDVAEDRFTGEVDVAKREAAYEGIKRALAVIPSFTGLIYKEAQALGLDESDYYDKAWYDTIAIVPMEEPTS
jgi:hypothetical protein